MVGQAIVKPQPWPLLEVVEVLGPGLAMATPRPGEDPFEGLVPMSVQRELQRCAEGAKRIGDAAAGRKRLDLEPLLRPRAVSPPTRGSLLAAFRHLPPPSATFCHLPPPSTAFHHLPPLGERIFATLESAVQQGEAQLMHLDLPHALQAS